MFNKIDWDSYKKAFLSFSCCHRISICKLCHKLINTNHQNQKYYGEFLILSENYHMQIMPQINKHKSPKPKILWGFILVSLLQILFRNNYTHVHLPFRRVLSISIHTTWGSLTKIEKKETPDEITSSIIHGMEQWAVGIYDSSHKQKAPSQGSVVPIDMLLTQAYSDQTSYIGLENFLRGRISNSWGKAYLPHQQVKKRWITSSSTWASNLIQIILEYSSSLWEFRNGVLHSHTIEETAAKEFNSITTRIRTAYQTYQEDPFHVPSHWRSLFISRTLDQCLKQDLDMLYCWLSSYDEALAFQRDFI